ncbi:MAG TPA: hypothetical protein VK974_00840 [Methylophilaceae bacterium]|nr:hypothetical protein [Methylophilaceae bacterium]
MSIPGWILPLVFTIVAILMALNAHSKDFGGILWWIVAIVLSVVAWMIYGICYLVALAG